MSGEWTIHKSGFSSFEKNYNSLCLNEQIKKSLLTQGKYHNLTLYYYDFCCKKYLKIERGKVLKIKN